MVAANSMPLIDPEMMLPELLAAHPQARPVFDRYGLSGCGGWLGPVESIRFFARSHGVDEARLLHELHEALCAPAPAPDTQDVPADPADTIYRRYFIGGIVVALTAGATWGAWLLWRIGFASNFTGISVHEVNAHGQAQIFGWVGLFVMGFACQALPRLWHTRLAHVGWAIAAFWSMIAGIALAAVGIAAGGLGAPAWALAAALAGGGLEALAAILFAAVIVTTFRRSDAKFEPYIGFAISAVLAFVAMSLFNLWHTYTTMTATTPQRLIWYVSAYQAPLRDLQIHGLALLMILGVCIRMLPALYEVPATPSRRAWFALATLLCAVVGEIGLFIAYRWTDSHILAALLAVPWILLTVGCAMVVLPWKLWRPFKNHDRSAKFIRTAYIWLFLSLAMLLLLPVYQAAYVRHQGAAGFSHAYYGAIRHAITVGFISLMIMGFAAKVVPTLNGLDVRRLSALWGPFILINVGCFLRVSFQTLTDWNSAFFHLVGISGMLEVTALAWWGAGLLRILRHPASVSADAAADNAPPQRIEPQHCVADVLTWFPATQRIFDRHGFDLLRRPLLRRTLARTVSLQQAAAIRGVCAAQLVEDLNQAAGRK